MILLLASILALVNIVVSLTCTIVMLLSKINHKGRNENATQSSQIFVFLV